MIDLARVDPRSLDRLAAVVDDLAANVGLDPDRVLVVGAECRDILHAAFGHAFALTATMDTDLGIAVSDWAVTERIDKRYRPVGSNGIRYWVSGVSVDIMPFGAVEQPSGISRPARRVEGLVVFGFEDVYRRALKLTLPGGAAARLPRPAGYAALKMRSWIDRSAHGHDKDAKDLALAAFWYQQSAEIDDRLYATPDGLDILAALDFDADLAAVRLLGIDVAAQLGADNRADLARRWAAADMDALARDFVLPSGARLPAPLARRRATVAQLMA